MSTKSIFETSTQSVTDEWKMHGKVAQANSQHQRKPLSEMSRQEQEAYIQIMKQARTPTGEA